MVMRTSTITFLVLGFVLCSVGSSLIFRIAAQHHGKAAILYFVLGNTVGIAVPICLTLALRGTNPNIIYAMTIGGAFCLLQLASWLVFKEPLSVVQWTGIALVAVGMLLLPFN